MVYNYWIVEAGYSGVSSASKDARNFFDIG